ncbi:AraC family transcriptional regulator [Ferruginibacter paludis]|uniref:helix-turn-helix domain-containing protein n=1 Tax=Ferruginibacter paludis TaxID=1310417 RepID=UPI0025B2B9F8|nr:AraC family transcriptional regulator [Ferruginibacter paludis]MDN3655768.1 AraC family transcriptional regulator [Ferruginibacter paludis]
MIVFNINHTDYTLLLKDLAAEFGIAFTGDDYVELPESAGKGCIKILKLFDELQVLVADVTFNKTLITSREYSDSRFFILHFDDVNITNTAKLKVDGETLLKTNTRHAVARLTSNMFVNTEELPAGLHIRSIKILFSESWLKKYLDLSPEQPVLEKYLSLKTESFDIESLDTEYLRLMDDIFQVPQHDPLQNIFLQNRVTLLIERFFTRLHDKSSLLEGRFSLTDDEVQRLIKVEQLLINNLGETPPTIDEFSKLVSMSSTKLKKSFKGIYGDSIYAYYQKVRMQKARELLMSGKYKVNEAASTIGYQNTSNFIMAFKKQFGISPGEVAGLQ